MNYCAALLFISTVGCGLDTTFVQESSAASRVLHSLVSNCRNESVEKPPANDNTETTPHVATAVTKSSLKVFHAIDR